MTDLDYTRKLATLDRMLNDPESTMDPAEVWHLLAEVSTHENRATPEAVPA